MKYEGPSEEDLERFSREDTGYCPECGEEVWDDAPQCKACGEWLYDGASSRHPVDDAFRKQSFSKTIFCNHRSNCAHCLLLGVVAVLLSDGALHRAMDVTPTKTITHITGTNVREHRCFCRNYSFISVISGQRLKSVHLSGVMTK